MRPLMALLTTAALTCEVLCGGCAQTTLRAPAAPPEPRANAADARAPGAATPAMPPSAPDGARPAPAGDDLWTQVRAALVLPDVTDRADVRAEIEVLRSDRRLRTTLLTRGTTLLPMVLAQVQSRGIPGEAVLLPYIESKLDPRAAHAGNVGMWQLRAYTARRNGLRVDGAQDERLDPVKSTRAVLDHLQRLAAMLDGDWVLAFAAYNTGEGALQAAMAAAPGRAFWQLPLPPQARRHMAKLAALAAVVREPSRYGITLPPIPARGDSKAESSSAADPPDSAGPAARDTDATVGSALAAGHDKGRAKGSAGAHPSRRTANHRVRTGDTLHAIAQRNHVTVRQLRLANRKATNLIHPGEVLVIPRG